MMLDPKIDNIPVGDLFPRPHMGLAVTETWQDSRMINSFCDNKESLSIQYMAKTMGTGHLAAVWEFGLQR